MRRLTLLAAALATVLAVHADNDAEDTATRLAPKLEQQADTARGIPAYIDLDANKIALNGADWTSLRGIVAEALDPDAAPFTILHIGDSHIQADGATGVTRRMLQERMGDGGRGLITPLRLAGTNEPRDYTFTSADKWTGTMLMRSQGDPDMSFTGIRIVPARRKFSFTVSTATTRYPQTPFSMIRVLFSGDVPEVAKVTDGEGRTLSFEVNLPEENESGYIDIILPDETDTATLSFSSPGSTVIQGVDLLRDASGAVYNIIGNNGATFASYNRLTGMGAGSALLMPDLIILSMGTNEAFGKVTDDEMYDSVDKLVTTLREANPEADFLLVTPMECQRSSYTSVASHRRRKGRKAGTRKVKTYTVNDNVKRMRDVILKYGRANRIPTYDFYTIAGGDGASASWLSDKLMNTDRIHNTWDGYTLQGELMYEALAKALGIQ